MCMKLKDTTLVYQMYKLISNLQMKTYIVGQGLYVCYLFWGVCVSKDRKEDKKYSSFPLKVLLNVVV